MATSEQIAQWTGGTAPLLARDIHRVSAPDSADLHCVVFAVTAQALQQALSSDAGLILANSAIAEQTRDSRVLHVVDARLAFAQVARHLESAVVGQIHASAVISVSAVIGRHTVVHAGAVVGDYVHVGDDCSIGPRVVLEAGVVLHNRVAVQAGAVIGALGFGYVRRPDGSYLRFPQQGTVIVENDVEIGANTTIDCGALGETRIGAGTKIDNLVHIGHNCRIGRNVIIAAQTGISGSSTVADGAILGGQVGIGEHAYVGEDVILGGGAGVLSGKKLRGPHQVFWGRPARPLKQYLRDLARLSRGR